MKIIDRSYRFHLPNLLSMDWFLDCHLQIFQSSDQVQTVLAKDIVLVTNMGFEMSWFIPNLTESLVNHVINEFNLDPQRLVWVEYYSLGDLKYHSDSNSTGFSWVTFDWQEGKVTQPHWVPMSFQGLQTLIGQDLKEVLEDDFGFLLDRNERETPKPMEQRERAMKRDEFVLLPA